MKITEEQRTKIVEAAKAAGVDPAEALAEAEARPEPSPPPAPAPATPDKKPASSAPAADGGGKIFAYHLPFMTPNQILASIGVESKLGPDGDMPSGEWLALHDGAATRAARGGGTPPPAPPAPGGGGE